MTNAGEVSVSGDANKIAYITHIWWIQSWLQSYRCWCGKWCYSKFRRNCNGFHIQCLWMVDLYYLNITKLRETHQVPSHVTAGTAIEEIQSTNYGVTVTMGAL